MCYCCPSQPLLEPALPDYRPATPADRPDFRASSHTPEPFSVDPMLYPTGSEDFSLDSARLLRIETAISMLSMQFVASG